MGGAGCVANMLGGSVFGRLLVMGTIWKIFFGRDEKMARGSLRSQDASLAAKPIEAP